MPVTVHQARTEADLRDAKHLFTAYTSSLNLDLSFQSLSSELSTLPGTYAPSKGGELLLARDENGIAIGCVALRALTKARTGSRGTDSQCSIAPADLTALPEDDIRLEKTAEAKRLYVDPTSRLTHPRTGLFLAVSIIRTAQRMGYDEVKLDSLGDMSKARRLYDYLGFVQCEPYYEVSEEAKIRGVGFWKLDLRDEITLTKLARAELSLSPRSKRSTKV